MQKEDFREISAMLDEVFFKNERAKEILQNANFTKTQISIINTLIITALEAYDLKKQNEK